MDNRTIRFILRTHSSANKKFAEKLPCNCIINVGI
jgi:hypothetical protein